MIFTVANLTERLQAIAPLSLAASWDNVGLLLGDPQQPVERVMTCLTVTPEVVAEAVQSQAHLIVSHHPILFRPTKKLTAETPEGRMLLDLIQARVAVYSAHTAYDNAAGGINDQLADKLGLTNVTPLRLGVAETQTKVVVFVPENDLAKVSEAMFAAGAGVIGQYRECGFRLAGIGTFFGSDAANPTVGQKGRREEVAEWRLEVRCPDAQLSSVIAALRRAHSYEEPAYDVYPLRAEPARHGEGRIGMLSEPISLHDFAGKVKATLAAAVMQIVGSPLQPIRRVALACGAAGEFLGDAVAQQGELFLTGEMRFHDVLAAQAQAIALILPGHYATERGGMELLAQRLQQEMPALTVWASRQERDPLASV